MVDDQNKKTLRARIARWLVFRLLSRLWYVHSPVILMIHATPSICLQTMINAARPSAQRLHLRNLFAQGRRYLIQPKSDGFRMTTTRNVRWRYRRRTSATTVMMGHFSPFGDDVTRIQLQGRIHIGYLLDTFLIPALLAAIIIYVPWHPALVGGALVIVLIFSWIGHRSNAILEAHEMIWFVQKALEDLSPADIKLVGAGSEDVLQINRDFEAAWEKFYAEQRGKNQE
jgi:hypothetical protein